jgi:hypothetical protein
MSKRPIWLTESEAQELAYWLSKDVGIVRQLDDDLTNALRSVHNQALKIACNQPDTDTNNPRESRKMSAPNNWQWDSHLPQTRRDVLIHGVQIAFGRLYATGNFGEYPNTQLEVARQAAFHLIDTATEESE